MKTTILYEAVSDIGCVRTNNEDMAYVAGKLVRNGAVAGDADYDGCLAFAVADGMGGYEGGEVASEIVCRSFASFIKTFNGVIDIPSLKQWVKEANNLLLDTARIRSEFIEMGTTFIGLVFCGNKCFLLNVGDSRCYRLRSGILKQLSTDHSERERTRNLEIPSNLIYNFMGQNQEAFFSDVIELTPLVNDVYILCSDGLSDMIEDEFMETNTDDLRYLVNEAKKAGGLDNITVIKIRI